jgi:catechol 2,3-dioxygenase-like lactoylglutathione lyase family enzyme
MVKRLMLGMLVCAVGGCASTGTRQPERAAGETMQLGNFSVSLAVADLAASREFYERLGFTARGGNADQNWLIMQNETATIGLFQGMFDKNALTFNPGWDRNAEALEKFGDVRDIQRELKSRGVTIDVEADPASTGPAFIMLTDPDGNPVLIDQHVARPERSSPGPGGMP